MINKIFMVNARVRIGGGGPSPAAPKPEEVPAPAAAATAEVPNGGGFPLKLPMRLPMRLRNLPMRSLSQSLGPKILRTEYLLTYLPKPSQLEKRCCFAAGWGWMIKLLVGQELQKIIPPELGGQ